MRTVKCFRWVTTKHTSQHGSVKWVPGEWVKVDGKLELCANGLHACADPVDSLDQVWGDEWWTAEARGKVLKGDNKLCATEMRIVKRIPDDLIRRLALDCAEHVYPIWEKNYPDDNRVRLSLDATKSYLDDPTPENKDKMTGAARAARAAGAAGAAEAAWAAEAARAAGAARAAWAAGAAWAAEAAEAARAAGAAGAAGAARAARAAEEKWQRKHLKQLIEQWEAST